MWLKLVGILCVFIGCSYIGWEKANMLKRRIWILQEMIQSLVLLKNLTETYRLPLNLVFEKISLQMKEPIAEFYKNLALHFSCQEEPEGVRLWQQTIEEMSDVFDVEDRQLFMCLGDFIGVQDIRTQVSAVEGCISEMRERVQRLESERPEREKLYKVLSLTIGSFLVILFI